MSPRDFTAAWEASANHGAAQTGADRLRAPCDANVMCRMLIQAQSNIICSVFLRAFSLRSIKLITALGFGLGRAKRGEMGEEGGSKQGLMAF